MKKIITSAFLLLFLPLFNGYQTWSLPPSKIQNEEVFGIDVSHWQGKINWRQVSEAKSFTYYQSVKKNTVKGIRKNKKIEYCFIKATEGLHFVDKRFSQNLQGCVQYKIPRTGYHYYRFAHNPRKQAHNYINNVPRTKINLPPVIDVEYKDNEILKPSELAKKPLNKEAFVRSLTILSNELEKHYQKKPILYTELSIYHTLIKDKFPNNPIWIREVRPVQSPNCPWLFWQFSVAKIDGIVKINKKRQYVNLVDINKFNGNKKDFNHFVNQKL
jgi:lysozyme